MAGSRQTVTPSGTATVKPISRTGSSSSLDNPGDKERETRTTSTGFLKMYSRNVSDVPRIGKLSANFGAWEPFRLKQPKSLQAALRDWRLRMLSFSATASLEVQLVSS